MPNNNIEPLKNEFEALKSEFTWWEWQRIKAQLVAWKAKRIFEGIKIRLLYGKNP